MKFIAPSIKRPIFAGLAVVATCLMITLAVRGSEPADSGWKVSRPMTVLDAKHADNPQIRIAINHMLEQSQTPLLLQAPAQRRAVDEVVEEAPAEEAPIVFGNYGASADGWRPAHLPTDSPRHRARTRNVGGTIQQPAIPLHGFQLVTVGYIRSNRDDYQARAHGGSNRSAGR